MALELESLLKTPPLSLYVHMPWCVRKCPYCDFNSHTVPDSIPADEYIAALIADLESEAGTVWGRPVGSIYFGGGTPSLFSAAHVEHFLSAARALLMIRPDVEITLEANPGTVEHDSFSAYAKAGVNRVSLGVQSFNDTLLKRIGRIHGKSEVDQAVASLHASGISNFNLDLMYALPGQTPAQALQDVELALAARPTHISYYHLTIEPNTLFAAHPPELPVDDVAWDMQQSGLEALESAGYGQYEISAFAQSDRQSRHNLNYWRYGDYVAIGAGAHGKITLPAEQTVSRYIKHKSPKRYLQGVHKGDWRASEQTVSAAERIFEFFVNQLRLKHGVHVDDFSPRTGLQWDAVQSQVSQAISRGLLQQAGDRLKPTPLGWKFVNDTQQLFLP